jgi:hypothetical protein
VRPCQGPRFNIIWQKSRRSFAVEKSPNSGPIFLAAASGIKMRRGTGNFPSLAASSSDYKEFRKAINCCCSLGDNLRKRSEASRASPRCRWIAFSSVRDFRSCM